MQNGERWGLVEAESRRLGQALSAEEWRVERWEVRGRAASDEVDAAPEDGPVTALLAWRLRERDAGLFERADPAGVCERLPRFDFLSPVAADEPAMPGRADELPRMTGARTGDVSMRDLMARFDVDAA